MKNIITITLLLIAVNVFSQNPIAFYEIYPPIDENPDLIYPYNGIQKSNGNYLIAIDYYIGAGTHSLWFVEFDQNGKFYNMYEYPTEIDYENMDYCYFHFDQKDNLLLSGSDHSFFTYLFDKNKIRKWEKRDYNGDTIFLDHVITNDNFYIGYIGSSIGKMDTTGKILWFHNLKDVLDSSDYYNKGIKYIEDVTVNGYYYVLLKNTKGENVVLTYDINGVLKNYQRIKNIGNIYKFNKTKNGFVFCPFDGYLVGVDDSLSIKWKYLPPRIDKPVFGEVCFDSAGFSYLYMEHKNDTNGRFYFEIIQIDSNGRMIKSIQCYPQVKYQNIVSFNLTKDKGYFLTFRKEENRALIMKIDPSALQADSNVIYLSTFESPAITGKIIVYPNPFSNYCSIQLPKSENGLVRIELYSLTGSLVRQESFSSTTYQFQRKDLQSGLYFYKILTSNKVYSGKLIITP